MLTIFKSRRGGEKVTFQGFRYCFRKHLKTNSETRSWRCENRQCRGIIHTKGNEVTYSTSHTKCVSSAVHLLSTSTQPNDDQQPPSCEGTSAVDNIYCNKMEDLDGRNIAEQSPSSCYEMDHEDKNVSNLLNDEVGKHSANDVTTQAHNSYQQLGYGKEDMDIGKVNVSNDQATQSYLHLNEPQHQEHMKNIMKPRFSTRSFLNGAITTITIHPNMIVNEITSYLTQHFEEIKKFVSKKVNLMSPYKVCLVASAQFSVLTPFANIESRKEVMSFIFSVSYERLTDLQLNLMNDAERLKGKFERYTNNGNGFKFDGVVEFTLKFARINELPHYST